jgi:hypothetical protein
MSGPAQIPAIVGDSVVVLGNESYPGMRHNQVAHLEGGIERLRVWGRLGQ